MTVLSYTTFALSFPVTLTFKESLITQRWYQNSLLLVACNERYVTTILFFRRTVIRVKGRN